MSKYYAQINDKNVVFAISQLHSDEESSDLIPLDFYDASLMGATYDSNLKRFPPPSPLVKTLAEVKQDKIAELGNAYYASFTTFQSSALGTAHTYPINKEAQDNITEYMQLMTLNPNMTVIPFKTLENGITDHTRNQFIQVLMDAHAFKVQLVKKFEDLEKKVLDPATDTEAKVKAITW